MFAAVRRAAAATPAARAFSTTSRRQDVAKLILVGRLGKAPEVRMTRSDKEYMQYTVATTNPSPPSNPDGSRSPPTTSWHTVLSFNPGTINYLKTMQKGWLVYVEAAYELREADSTADPDSPAAHRQIFLRHESIRVLKRTANSEESSEE